MKIHVKKLKKFLKKIIKFSKKRMKQHLKDLNWVKKKLKKRSRFDLDWRKHFHWVKQNHHHRHWFGILVLLAVSVFSMNLHYEAGLLLSSVLDVEEHKPFDGTVMPIQVAPDWTNLSSAEYQMSYHDLDTSKLEPIPEYNLDYIGFPSSNLVWGRSEHDVIRNTKITYPVPYAGNYKLDDCGEHCGSHPGVDIKVAKDTPVYVIANGIVTKAGYSSGFGNYVVVKHNDVPEPGNSSQTTTVYSNYAHLSDFFVTEGQALTKGEVIGEVGSTGTATTNHLHFQLDSQNAPWHPYWPFTSADAANAGYGFWEAVNQGIGKDNLYAYTYNPMDWVKEHIDGATATVEEEEEVLEDEEPVEEELEVVLEEEEEVLEEEEIPSSVVTVDFDLIELEVPNIVMIGQNKSVIVTLLRDDGSLVEDPRFDGKIEISVSDETLAKVNRSYLEAIDFEDGEAEIKIYADHEGSVDLIFEIADRTFISQDISLIDEIEPFAKFGVVSDGSFVPGVSETVQIQAQTLSGNPTPSFYGDGTVELEIVEGNGTLSETKLTKKDFPTGVAEVELLASSDEDVIIRATYGTKVSESRTIKARIFSDFDGQDDYYDAVSYLFRKGTIEGYPDGSFRPTRTVSRVEALKLIFSGLDQDVASGLSVSFADTQSGQWYSDYLATAYSLGVVQGYNDGHFRPTQGVNRVEFLKMLFTTLDVNVDPIVLEDPYKDVNNLSWHAPYVQYAKEKNIFPVSGQYFEPSNAMSRVEVAEVIYRLIVVEQNDGEPYSVRLGVR